MMNLVTIFPTSFTVFDVETTGLSAPSGDRIVEIGAVRIEGGEIRSASPFLSLVNPQREIPWEARSINGITEDELVHAPTIDAVLPQFLEFAKDSILVAHNAEFDMGFLHAEKEMCWGYIDIPECLCTLTLSRTLSPHEYRHSLDAVATRLGVTLPLTGRHRALPDVLLTAQVFLKLLERGHINTLSELQAKAAPQAGMKPKSRVNSWQSA